jgi:hypothetical protein
VIQKEKQKPKEIVTERKMEIRLETQMHLGSGMD